MKGITAVLVAAIVLASGVVQGHGETHSMEADAARKEQQAWGIASDRKAVTRTIEIEMLDEMRFTPARIDARQGETVRLVARNRGKLMHELVLGTQKELDEHAATMARSPGMQHGQPYMVHVAPGEEGEILWTFNRPGTFQFACLVAGHYQAGMRGTITVAAGKAPRPRT